MRYDYIPRGVCARKISFDLEDGVVSNVEFQGGCNGNLKAIAKLVEGKHIDEVETLLAGIRCRNNTSCPDQLSKAIGEWKAAKNEQ